MSVDQGSTGHPVVGRWGRQKPGTGLLALGLVLAVALLAYTTYGFAVQPHQGRAPERHLGKQATSRAHILKIGIATWRTINGRFSPRGSAKTGAAIRVVPASIGPYGAQIPTFAANPLPGQRVRVSLWLKATSSPRLEIEVDKFRAGAPNRFIIRRAVRVTQAWRHFSLTGRVRGRWLGLGLEIYSPSASLDSFFAVRGLTVAMP
jgi:hypothetical protein